MHLLSGFAEETCVMEAVSEEAVREGKTRAERNHGSDHRGLWKPLKGHWFLL